MSSKYEKAPSRKLGSERTYDTRPEQRLTVNDVRDYTARFCGDPIPGDQRRQLFPGKNYAGTERWWDK